jgi:predicted site-specific integrase-resolvase
MSDTQAAPTLRSAPSPASKLPPTLLVHHAAKLAGVSRRSVYYWMQAGLLPWVEKNGHRRVTVADIERAKTYRRHQKEGIIDV